MATYGTFTDGSFLKASEANDFFVSTAYTPQLIQTSTSTLSTAVGQYYRVNKLVVVTARMFVSTAAAVAGARIESNLPVNAASNSAKIIGWGRYHDSGSPTDIIPVAVVQYSSTRVAFLTESSTSLTAYLGTTGGPAITVAANDQLIFYVAYEVA